MIRLGKTNTLTVIREVDFGLYIGEEKNEILLPIKHVPEGTKVGDELNVFVYKDSEDRPIATTLVPYAELDQYASLKVVSVTSHGAFMDWGIEKDLFVPFKEQRVKMEEGETHVVRICFDYKTSRLIGVTKLNEFLDKNVEGLNPGEEVNLHVFDHTELGYSVIINGSFRGLIYNNDVFEAISIGDEKTGYIKEIRADGKVDVSLRKEGVEAIDSDKQIVLDKLKASEVGELPINDRTSPEEIKQQFEMSKKAFKKAIGGLYKSGLIEILDSGIKLKSN